ncbi:MAG: hypothetical protein WCD89_05935 [Anaerocolumna sp.]
MNYDITPEQKTGAGATGPPKIYTVQPPKDPSRCEGCPYSGVGFICWSADGSCMKTDMEKISHRSKGR